MQVLKFPWAIGAKYTYAEAPPGNWLRDAFGLDRNPFDRVGHFAQGFTPALIAREVLVRVGEVRRAWLVLLLSAAVPLAFSALYEIVEWGWVLAFYPDQGPEWLGMQGDPWDAQWDMFMALVGAAAALVCLGPLQSRWLATGVITAMLLFASSVLPFVNTAPRMARKSAVCDRCDTRVASMPLAGKCRATLI
ncbi:MAG TPA: DUF2238 domain-containing protein [Pirellulales bacterium]|nr:DUF2238 domain-containing protein [Pirellulales bacterium]